MQIIVTDRESIEQGLVVRAGAYTLVSIRDPYSPEVRIPRPSALRDVLELVFDDVEPIPGYTHDWTDRPMTYMDDSHARRIVAFVQAHRHNVQAIVCHCEAGMSRSPAVAAAIAAYLGQDADHFFQEYMPNRYVHALVSRAFEAVSNPSGSGPSADDDSHGHADGSPLVTGPVTSRRDWERRREEIDRRLAERRANRGY